MKVKQLIQANMDAVNRALEASDAPERVDRLTLSLVRKMLDALDTNTVVIAHDADDAALSVLREQHRSYYIERTGETYLAPPEEKRSASVTIPRTINPFARKASRVPRYLLLHPDKSPTIQELADAVDIDKSVVSRVAAQLAAEGLVEVTRAQTDERAKNVRVPDPLRLLEAWGNAWRRYRPRPERFDIGTRTVDATLRAIADAHVQVVPWAISGLAGAALIRRVVEPADVLLLTNEAGVEEWMRTLYAERTQVNRGLLRIAVLPDEYPFELVRRERDLLVADPVQLWLDTSASGERALEAQNAVARSMGW